MTEEQRLELAKEHAQAFIINNLGIRYEDARFEGSRHTAAVEYIRKLSHGQLMVLHGNPDTGKTYAAACWIRRYIEGNLYKKGYVPGIYITANVFEQKFCQPGFWDAETRSKWNDLLDASWVVLDDLGTENPTNAKFSTQFNQLFETRHRHERTLIILTNIRIDEYGERIVSRIRDWAVEGSVWEIQGEDLRKSQSELRMTP